MTRMSVDSIYWPFNLTSNQWHETQKRGRPQDMKVASMNNSPSSVVSTPSMLTVILSFRWGEYYKVMLAKIRSKI